MADEPDILDTTPPEGIPGALFAAVVRILLDSYKVGSMNPQTAAGAGAKAQNVAVEIFEKQVAFYEAIVEEEG